ncbi:hypothetical protein P4641_03685 [Halalkalibacterium halodurans]|uniref:hypothetical protein n=1 Tax=Halalkalibacterium halodurans TaxID=86665 RepID=UPI002E1FAFD7|nr:hypothetical protein [Halalkalibacterium halodurans]
MIEIVSGSFEKCKAELKHLRAGIQDRKKAVKNGKRTMDLKPEQVESIKYYERVLHLTKVSQMIPVSVGKIIINYGIYQQLVKKLKGFEMSFELQGDKLIISYSKGSQCGAVALYDLTPILGDMKAIPKAVIKEGVNC